MTKPPQIEKQDIAVKLSRNVILSGFAGVCLEFEKLEGDNAAEKKLADTLSHLMRNGSLTKAGENFLKEKINESRTLQRTYNEYITQVLAKLQAELKLD